MLLSEAKNLGNTHFMISRFFVAKAPLNDKIKRIDYLPIL